MTSSPFRFESLGSSHDRTLFRCGDEVLDRYFQTQATQDIRRRIANCFVAVETATGQVAAYYTLSAASIPLVDLPAEEAKRLPRYPTLPAVDAKNDQALAFYQHHGFRALASQPRTLFLPITTIQKALRPAQYSDKT
jgi:hypothetical protein